MRDSFSICICGHSEADHVDYYGVCLLCADCATYDEAVTPR